ncbi:DUF2723 domain-containing protein [candidate division KSB1 bacterium]|nr:DUF2723 domain-containing protein [candidate division KSB1 bacterium]NIR72806.1 DUF2723 domain-containing protein [candidate division KSB1 bacterium]NIS26846.1 DUF2723 domain-containing protein [candidate division KSB1 bacterium]NIT73642.1 DUF2723 domain-containing protein [candidate division KSB1 bacterium]NIU27513.1 DUF2723 domain-containing protein [candidate division KSB1 bacterium]
MEHKRLDRIIAFIIFLVGLIVYGKTVAPTTSFWDCGEFIACSHTLGVPHPPGAPLYILIGRIFTMLPIFDDIGLRVNIISVIVSAFTIMFTYLVIVRLVRQWRGTPETIEQKIIVYTGGVIGALAFAFSDSFWFNAVEAEVYAVSMFFTAIVVWLILVWLEKVDQEEHVADRILLLIAYLVGLATGVHLLNILALPSVFLIIYFKRGQLNFQSFFLFAAAAAVGFVTIYPIIVKGVPWVLREFSFLALGLLVLALVAATFYSISNQKRILSLALMALVLVSVGYSTYTTIYIRSGLQPAINENNPSDPDRFASYLNREQYGDIPLTQRRAPMWEYQIKKMYVRYFNWQFVGKGTARGPDGYISEIFSTRGLWGLPFLLGLVGMTYHLARDWKRWSVILVLFIMTGVAISIYLNQEDPQPRERDYAYVGSFFAFSIWIGIGASALLEVVSEAIQQSALLKKIGIALMIVLLFFAVPIKMFGFNFHSHDRTGNYVAYDYSYNILQSCEPNAIIFTNGDNDTFPLWFLQYVYGIRKDVRVVNLSLLNTPWYIKQLRDDEPKVPINFKDTQIDQLVAIPWQKTQRIKIPVPRKRVLEYLKEKEDNATVSPEDVADKPAIEFDLANTTEISQTPVILVQDRMIVHIIGANQFRRPIYFAVTVSPQNMLGLNNRRNKELPNHLRMDGLVFQIMPYGGPDEFISHEKLQTNLFEKFQYRNLNNPDVYYNDNIKGLLQNYRSAFLRLTNYYLTKSKQDAAYEEKALAVLDKMNEVIPEDVVPLRDYRLSLNFGRLYAEAGRPEELDKRIDRILDRYQLPTEDKIYILELFADYLKNPAKAESLAVSFLDDDPRSRYIVGWLLNHYSDSGQAEKGVEILQEWLAKHPEDQGAKTHLTNLQAQMDRLDSTKSTPEEGGSGSNNGADTMPE